MTYIFLLLAALAGASFNFAFRRSSDGGGRSHVFLFLQCFFAFLFVTLLNVRLDTVFDLDRATLSLGLFEGAVYVAMMTIFGKAFQKGPPGLTVATMNSASIMPGILMALIFGISFGHGFTLFNGLGSCLVVLGLFWAALSNVSNWKVKEWALFATAAFLGHSLYLSIMQWRVLLLTYDDLPFFAPALKPESAHWFQSLIFLSATVIQAVIYYTTDGSSFKKKEVFWAMFGGAANGLCTFGLVRASEIATDAEKAMIFPIAGVTSIFLCNLWGKWVYKEKVNWGAIGTCLSGIVIGTVSW